jgi:uncharacterized protein (TIGR02466 family)
MQPINVWPVIMYDFQWAQHQKYKQQLKQVCQDLESKNSQSNVAPSAKRGLYESGFDFVTTPDPAVEALSHWIKDCLFKSAANANREYWPAGANINIEIHESWCHITRDGGYHDMHTHPGSSWSAIYYLDTGNMDAASKNGLNRFFCPYNNMYIDAGTAWTSRNTSIDITAQEGMLIVFPSFIQHNALSYRGEKERYVISVNSKVSLANLSTVTLTT